MMLAGARSELHARSVSTGGQESGSTGHRGAAMRTSSILG